MTPEMAMAAEQAARMGVPGGPGQPLRAFTGGDGRFVFRDLAPGTYNASAILTGYAPGALGRRRLEGLPRPIDLSENERVVDASIRLWKLGSISGTVVDEAGEPMIGLQVRALRRTTTAGRRRYAGAGAAQTDDRGMYRIAPLSPGDYVVVINSVATSAPAASVAEYFEAMSSGSTAGRNAMSQRRMETGAPFPASGGVMVGDQLVQINASPISGGSTVVPMQDGRLLIYRTTFYPAATGVSQASIVTLASGDARTGVDLSLKPAPTVRVSGTLTVPDGPPGGIGVRLVPADTQELTSESGFEAAISMTDASGHFTLLGVPAGQYIAKAYRVPRGPLISSDTMSVVGGVMAEPTILTPPTAPTGPSFFAETTVVVGDSDVVDVSLAFRSGMRVSGQFEFEGTATRPTAQRLQQLLMTLSSVDGRLPSPGGVPPARADAEGRFTSGGLPPGRYWISPPTPGPEWSVKSILAGGVNVLDRPIELTSADVTGVVVTYTDRTSELSGTVQGAGADDDVTVVVFPADHQAWLANGRSPRRIMTASARQNGTYTLRLPPPGEYIVVAVLNDSMTDGDAALYASLARVGTRLSVAEGDKKSLPLTATRVR
jgi:hypothetical protein